MSANGVRVSFLSNVNAVQLDKGDACTSLPIYKKTMMKMVNFMVGELDLN